MSSVASVGFKTKLPGQWTAAANLVSPLQQALNAQRTASAPTVVNTVPPGDYYDPSLDVQAAAAQRGYGDLSDDFASNFGLNGMDFTSGRSGHDLQQALYAEGTQGADSQADLATNLQRTLQGLGVQRTQLDQGYQRNVADLGTSDARNTTDYQTALGNLSRSYQQLGRTQTQASVAGGGSRGALAMALAARTSNQAIDRAPIQTSYDRATQDSATQRARLGQDYTSGVGQLDQAFQQANADYGTSESRLERDDATQRAQLGLDYSRGFDDANTQLQRAGRELGQFQTDTQNARIQQATALGWQPTVSSAVPAFGSTTTKPAAKKNPTRRIVW